MAKTTYIDEQGRRKTGYTEGLNIPMDSIYAKRLEQLGADTQRQINNLNADYEGMNTQLYRDYMKSKKTLPQQLSAQGISGGLSESTNLGLETLYSDRLLQNEKNRLRGINDIETAAGGNRLNIMKDYTADAAERANTMASIGDFSGYKDLGYTDEQIAALKAAWDAKNAPKVSGGGVTLRNPAQIVDRKLQSAVTGKGEAKLSVVLTTLDNMIDRGLINWNEREFLLDKYGL